VRREPRAGARHGSSARRWRRGDIISHHDGRMPAEILALVRPANLARRSDVSGRKKCAISSGPRSGGLAKMMIDPNASESNAMMLAGRQVGSTLLRMS
jgi:hypothetical protein